MKIAAENAAAHELRPNSHCSTSRNLPWRLVHVKLRESRVGINHSTGRAAVCRHVFFVVLESHMFHNEPKI